MSSADFIPNLFNLVQIGRLIDSYTPAHQEPSHGSEPAGLDISGKAVEADVDDYDSYKTFEIEFENSPSMSPLSHIAQLV